MLAQSFASGKAAHDRVAGEAATEATVGTAVGTAAEAAAGAAVGAAVHGALGAWNTNRIQSHYFQSVSPAEYPT